MTSLIDWCEPNYMYTPFIAELWNTLSSIWILLLGLYGFKITSAYTFLLLSLVGVGSTLFHAHLTWYTQLLDEIPMLFTVCYYLYQHNQTLLFPVIFVFACVIYIFFQFYTIFTFIFISLLIYHLYDLYNYITHLRYRQRRKYYRDYSISLTLYVIAFTFWIIDHIFCYFGYDLHCHFIWHILSGYSSYVNMLLFYVIHNDKYINWKLIPETDTGLPH